MGTFRSVCARLIIVAKAGWKGVVDLRIAQGVAGGVAREVTAFLIQQISEH